MSAIPAVVAVLSWLLLKERIARRTKAAIACAVGGIALSLLAPNSGSATTAGERGWIPVSGQFFHRRYLRGHWEKYVEGCERVGRRPDPSIWRVSRSVLVTESDAQAEEYLAELRERLSG